MNIVAGKGISKVYSQRDTATEVKALSNVSIHVGPGEIVGVYGPSGSGKTTLLNILGLLDTCDVGCLHIFGRDVSKMGSAECADFRREKIGLVFQSFNLLPELTALENVEIPLAASSNSRRQVRNSALAILGQVGLFDRTKHFPSQLSGGQQQRVGIARALVHKPMLVLADEPTANLDTDSGKTIIDLMQTFAENNGTAFVFSTHDHRILEIAHQTIRLEDGVLQEA